MKMAESSCGLGTLGKRPPSSLNLLSQHNHLLPKHSIPQWLNSALLHLLPTRNDGNLPSCFVTWSLLPNAPANSTPKTTGTWYVRIKQPVLRWYKATMDISLNCSVTDCSCTSAIPRRTKTMRSVRYVRG